MEDSSSGSSDEAGEYEVEKIVDVQHLKNGTRKFLVRWKGFSPEADTWEPESNLNCKDLIKKFFAVQGKAKEGKRVSASKSKNGRKAGSEVTRGEGESRISIRRSSRRQMPGSESNGDDLDRRRTGLTTTKFSKTFDVNVFLDELMSDSDSGRRDGSPEGSDDGKENEGSRRAAPTRWTAAPKPESNDISSEDIPLCYILANKRKRSPTGDRIPVKSKRNESSKSENAERSARGKLRGRAADRNKENRKESTAGGGGGEDGEDRSEKSEEYEVERIVDVRFLRDGTCEFLIKWRGYSSRDNSWEPQTHLNCKDMLEQFWKKVEKMKNVTVRELRIQRKKTCFFHSRPAQGYHRKLRCHLDGFPRKTYIEID